MCKIFLVINKNPKAIKTIKDLVNVNISKLSEEKDGYSIQKNNKTFFYDDSEISYKNMNNNIAYKDEKLFIVHSRTSTAGDDNINGLHLQTLFDDWVFAHNGTIDKFSNVITNSDSYYFFKHLLKKYKKITIENINKHSQDCGFSGKGLLYNKKTSDLYWFCNQVSYITILDNALILSSYSIETKKKEYKVRQVLGYKWFEEAKETEIEGIIHAESFDNTYLHFKNSLLIETGHIDNKSYSGSSYNSYNGYRFNSENQSYYKDKEEKVINQLSVLE